MLAIFAIVCLAAPAHAQDALRLAVPSALEKSGFVKFLVPRFALKAGLRITRVAEGQSAEMRFVAGDPVAFEGLGQGWMLEHDGDARAVRFAEWLHSDVGRRTIESFEARDGSRFFAQRRVAAAPQAVTYDGDLRKGERLSLDLCGRCHVINAENRMKGMGATPSFAVLRSLGDWDDRFTTFHLRNPHPSFTQITDVTEPFDPALPPPIVPLEMTQTDLEAILAYVSRLSPADLGAPLQVQ